MSVIVLDTMGSDHGVEVLVKGACDLSLESNDIQTILVGPSKQIQMLLHQYPHDPSKLEIEDASSAVSMDANPRDIPEDSSLFRALQLVKNHKNAALVSAGNTGAVIVGASRTFDRLEGIKKSALAAVYPTEKKHGPRGDPFALMLDVGATLHVDAEELVAFALMGSVYAQIISDNPRPKIALLSNGSEANKGAPEVVQAHRILKSIPSLNFMGNVEGLDIPKGTADVIVCEGFLGNVALKMIEGVGEVASALIKDASEQNLIWRLGIGMLYQGIQQLKALTDWKQYGGAPILGLNRVVIKAHGRSNARAIRNAIKLANKAVERDMISRIAIGLEDALTAWRKDASR